MLYDGEETAGGEQIFEGGHERGGFHQVQVGQRCGAWRTDVAALVSSVQHSSWEAPSCYGRRRYVSSSSG